MPGELQDGHGGLSVPWPSPTHWPPVHPAVSALGNSHIQMALGRTPLVSSLSLTPHPYRSAPRLHTVFCLLHVCTTSRRRRLEGSHCTSDGPVKHKDKDTYQNSLPSPLSLSVPLRVQLPVRQPRLSCWRGQVVEHCPPSRQPAPQQPACQGAFMGMDPAAPVETL